MASNRWVAIDPDILHHPLVGAGQKAVEPADKSRGAYSRMEAWVWLICNASFADHTINNRGRKMTLERGDLLGAWAFLAHQWNWSAKTVRTWVEKLIADNMLRKKAVELQIEHNKGEENQGTERGKFYGNQTQILSVVNYWRFQFERYEERQPIGQAPRQAIGNQRATKGQHITREQGNIEREKEARAENEMDLTAAEPADRSISAEASRALVPVEPPIALTPVDDEVDPVTVNGVAIYGPNFKLPFKAIDMTAGLIGMDPGRARLIAEICARGWAANKMKPAQPMAMVNAAIKSDFNQGQIAELRLQRSGARSGGSSDQRAETARMVEEALQDMSANKRGSVRA